MKYIFLWDINGKPWRKVIEKMLPKYVEKYNPDFVIANSENLTHWKGANSKHLDEMQEIWINFFTWWNHTFWTKDAMKEFDLWSKRQLRPINYPKCEIWYWYFLIDEKFLLISAMWNVFMWIDLDNPFLVVEDLFAKIKSEIWEEKFQKLDIFIDFHAETTSEKKTFAYNFDWIATWIFGTHTHVQTNDAQILQKWTWYITDLWMNWAMESVLWVQKDIIIKMMKTQIYDKFELEEQWKYEFSGVFVETENWKCKKIEAIKDFL